jgi:hypothetical protein
MQAHRPSTSRRRSRLPLFLLLASALLPVLAACGSTVTEPSGSGGGAGAGGDSSVGGASACNSFPSPAGFVSGCGTVQGAGGAQPVSCSACKVDESNHEYHADCVGPNCTCTYVPGSGAAEIGCSCTMTAACKVTFPTCCPLFL